MAKKALITGASGQDGAYLAQLLLNKGYKVYGAVRRTSSDLWRFHDLGIERDVEIVPLNLLEPTNIFALFKKLQADEVYNLAAISSVSVSLKEPLLTSEINAMGVCRLMKTIWAYSPDTKFFQASTSEMFGKAKEYPQKETTPFHPRNPYGIAKLYAHLMTAYYREVHGMFACSGILFNHESPFRGPEFVTRKITMGLAAIRKGRQDVVRLGNLDAKRDWGFAGDYVAGMCSMLSAQEPGDYVLATGVMHSVRDFVDRVAECAGFDIEWCGEGMNEVGRDRETGRIIIEVDPQFYRPTEAEQLIGDNAKAQTNLGWQPVTSFDTLAEMMMRADIDRTEQCR